VAFLSLSRQIPGTYLDTAMTISFQILSISPHSEVEVNGLLYEQRCFLNLTRHERPVWPIQFNIH
jgi:hypothetical protein